MKPRVRILLPIWGAEYIRSFQQNGLRSLLAPGNLPTMAQRCETEFVFLSPARDRDVLNDSPFVRQLESICSVKIVEIDDLLIDNSLYGYTLTYAYHRGILSAGERLTETHFVFIVSDYVFSENSFGSLSHMIVGGDRVILSSSLRVDAELVEPRLAALADGDAPLAVGARDVLRVALRNPHPSLQAKIVNRPENTGFSTNYQHLYWQIYPNTLISRNFMAHMLCIRPDFCPPKPRGFCDYTFIPDMAPNAPFAWLDDSDDYLALELQERNHEAGFTHPGKREMRYVAESLSSWTTVGHRAFADHTFVFHAGDMSPTFDRVDAEATAFIAEIKSRLVDEPKSHLNHPHWDPICEMIVERAQERWHHRAAEARAPETAMRKFNFAMQVWGQRYVDVLLNVGLPSQLSTGNFESFPWLNSSIYEIYTTRADANRMRSSQVFRWLQVLMEIRIVYIDDELTAGKWTNVRYCHREAVKSADARGAALFFLCPDQVWPDGSITRAARLIDEEGYTAVMCPGPRAIEEDMVPLLRRRYLSADGTSLCVPPRDLVKAGLDHFHPEMVEWLWDAPEYFGYPSYVMFDVPGQGIVAQCYILHPVVVNPEVRNLPPFYVFDQDYLMNSCPDLSKIYVAQDSDDVFHFELSPRDVSLPPPARPVRPDPEVELMWYGEKQFNAHHRVFAKIPIRIHYAEIDPGRWHPVEQRAGEIIARIDRGWDISDWLLAYRYPDHLIRRMETRYRYNPDDMTPEDRHLLDRASVVASRRHPRLVDARDGTDASSSPLLERLSGVTQRLARQAAAEPTPSFSQYAAASVAELLERLGGVTQQLARQAAEPTSAVVRNSAQSVADAVTAIGYDNLTASRLSASFNQIVAADFGAGVMLPGSEFGPGIRVHNNTEYAVRVYATAPDVIDDADGAVGIEIPARCTYLFTSISDGAWISSQMSKVNESASNADRALVFDEEYYLRTNPDVSENGMDPHEHFQLYGWKESRDPSAYFSVRGYLEANPDVYDYHKDPLHHFRVYGFLENRLGWQK